MSEKKRCQTALKYKKGKYIRSIQISSLYIYVFLVTTYIENHIT